MGGVGGMGKGIQKSLRILWLKHPRGLEVPLVRRFRTGGPSVGTTDVFSQTVLCGGNVLGIAGC